MSFKPDTTLPDRIHTAAPKMGVLLVNLGTPDEPTPEAIRRYLAEFLLDERVVDLPRILWLAVLYLFILPFRPGKLAHAYQSVWTEQGSPLLSMSQALAQGVRAQLHEDLAVQGLHRTVVVELGMRYGNPSVPAALDRLTAENCRQIVVLPLFPQYSAATNASAFDAVWSWMRAQRWVPEIRTINCYHDHPAYISALAESVRQHWSAHGKSEHLVLSFHGVPQRFILAGDPYYCHCQKTGRLLAESLGLSADQYSVAFQSRFGREPWLLPYMDDHLAELAQRGVLKVDTICPGFSADCLETLEEVAIRYKASFASLGGELRYIPALNAQPMHVELISQLARDALLGMSTSRSAPSPATIDMDYSEDARAERLARAQAARVQFDGLSTG